MSEPNNNGVTYQIDGIDWGTATGSTTTVVTTNGQTFDSGYTPYIPLTVTHDNSPTFTYTFNYQPVLPTEHINMTFTIDKNGYANFVRQEDHFVGQEDLFEI